MSALQAPAQRLTWTVPTLVTSASGGENQGDFPSPELSLSSSSAQVGDLVSVQCALRPNILADAVIFCQDGKEISSQLAMPGQSLYQYNISVRSSGRFRCMYQYRINQNKVNNSCLSLPRTLNATGDFPSPTLSLSTSSAQVGDSVSAQCSLRPNSLAALVIFCQDGKEISSQLTTPGQSLYQYKISVQNSGQFRFMYQYRINQNQVNNSRLSLPWTLNVTDRSVHSGDADHSSSGSSEKKSIPD
ncbi:hypothetical protein KIL84_001655, partial [Mauremys mutica]